MYLKFLTFEKLTSNISLNLFSGLSQWWIAMTFTVALKINFKEICIFIFFYSLQKWIANLQQSGFQINIRVSLNCTKFFVLPTEYLGWNFHWNQGIWEINPESWRWGSRLILWTTLTKTCVCVLKALHKWQRPSAIVKYTCTSVSSHFKRWRQS